MIEFKFFLGAARMDGKSLVNSADDIGVLWNVSTMSELQYIYLSHLNPSSKLECGTNTYITQTFSSTQS